MRAGSPTTLVALAAAVALAALLSGCLPCDGLRCGAGEEAGALEPATAALAPMEPALVVVVTLDSVSRLTARWRLLQGRNRGARRGAVVEQATAPRALLAVSALPSPLRISAEPSCEGCVKLAGAMPLQLELGVEDGPQSSLGNHPARLLAHWSLVARVTARWGRGAVEVRLSPQPGAEAQIELNWQNSEQAAAGGADLELAVRREAIKLAGRVISSEALRAVAEIQLLRLPQWRGARELFPDSALAVQVDGPLLRLVLSAPLGGPSIDATAVRPGVSQDVVIAASLALLQHHSFALGSVPVLASAPPGGAAGAPPPPAQLLSLAPDRRSLRYRVHAAAKDRAQWFTLEGRAQPGRRGATAALDLIGPPRLIEAGGRAGHTPPGTATLEAAARAALQPAVGLLAQLHAFGPGDTRAGLLIARHDAGAVLLESTFSAPRTAPAPDRPQRLVRPAAAPRLRGPKPPVAGHGAPPPAAPARPWAHPAPQSGSPSSR